MLDVPLVIHGPVAAHDSAVHLGAADVDPDVDCFTPCAHAAFHRSIGA